MKIDGREIGTPHSPYVVAEISGNHNGDLQKALDILEAAKLAGADAVKLQTYTADTLTIDCRSEDFLIKSGLWKGSTLYELYKKANTPWEWHEILFKRGQELGITVFSSPFDATAVDFLETLNCPAYKIASFEAVDLPLIEKVATTGKPIIISTGLADLKEIQEAVTTAKKNGCNDIALMHCVSAYPTPVEDCDLKMISELSERFDSVIGWSDHTSGIEVALASIPLGASIIEKHITFKRSDGGPDAAFSLEPDELKKLCFGAEVVWKALGCIDYSAKQSELSSMVFRRSLYVTKDICAGEIFSVNNVRSIRPGYGLAPKYFNDILGKVSLKDIKKGTPIDWSMIVNRKADI